MTPKRFFYVMSGVNVILILLIIVCAYYGDKLISSQAVKLTQAKVQDKVANAQQLALTQAKLDVEKYQDLNNVVKTIVPQDKDQAKTVLEITKIAEESGITLKAINFQASNLGLAVPKSTAPGSTTPTPATKLPDLSQVKAVEGISGVYALEINVASPEDSPVSYDNLIKFLGKLENNRRTAHVDEITIKPNEKSGGLSFTLTLNAYVKP